MVVGGQQPVARLHIGQEERVVDHQQMGCLRGVAGLPVEVVGAEFTAAVALPFAGWLSLSKPKRRVAAAIFRADGRVRRDLPPEGALFGVVDGQLGEIARAGVGQPGQYLCQQTQFDGRQLASPAPLLQAPGAEIVLAAFEQGGAQRRQFRRDFSQQFGQPGNLLFQQLLLQGDCVGGDHSPLVVGRGPERRGQQIGHTFARACARFDHPVAACGEGVQHQMGHLHLSPAGFVMAVQLAGQGAVVGKGGVEGLRRHQPRHLCAVWRRLDRGR